MAESITPQLKEHYELEKKLANKIRSSPWPERGRAYQDAYNEIYEKIPNHPLMTEVTSGQKQSTSILLGIIQRFLIPNSCFLEIGPGNCSLLIKVSELVKKAYGVDVSTATTKDLIFPENSQILLSDGRNIPLPDDSVDVAFSHQFIEHLHPEDAMVHLENVYRTLRKDGVYICITPNRLSGPHDISRYFGRIATCFHLKEYTVSELSQIMKQVGFSKVKHIFGFNGIFITFPMFPAIICEWILNKWPYKLQIFLAKNLPFKLFINVRLIGYK